MADYKEQSIQGSAWQRCNFIGIQNPRPHLGIPSVTFEEEQVTSIGGTEFARPVNKIVENFTEANALEQFALLDPVTGAPVGTATYQQLYVLLYSAYLHCASKRDTAQAAG